MNVAGPSTLMTEPERRIVYFGDPVRASFRLQLWTWDRTRRKESGAALTPACFAGYVQNAESLFLLCKETLEREFDLPIHPWLMGSQTCEDHFRALRAVMGQDAGMDLAELLRRSHKVQVGNLLGATLSLSHHKRSRLYDSGTSNSNAKSTGLVNSQALLCQL